jgi:O-antigen biosynthesis protein
MAHLCSETHLYTRILDPDGEDSLARIARRIRPQTKVLDLGTGPGVLGKHLATALNCLVDGVEFSAEQARLAAPFYRDLQIADLEQIELSRLFSDRYDYIVCADVLEHLKNPGGLVAQLPALLKSDGRILLSIPNIAHAGVIAELLAGEFRYRPEGLLDTTHLRFFTRKSLLALLQKHNLASLAIETVSCDLRESEFRGYFLEVLPPAIYQLLSAYPDALSYQFIVEAAPGQQAAVELLEAIQSTPEFHFACQVYWRLEGSEYKEEHSVQALGRIGAEQQVIRFSLPPLGEAPAALRVDPADRAGFLRLYQIALYDSKGDTLWRWNGELTALQAAKAQQMEFADTLIAAFGVNALLMGKDPFFELPLPGAALAPLKAGGVLELSVSWPLSADFMVLIQHLKQKEHEAAGQHQLLWLKEQEIESGKRQLQEKTQQLELVQKQLGEKERQLTTTGQEVQQLAARVAEQQNTLNAYEQQLVQASAVAQFLEVRLAYQESWWAWVRRPFRPLKRWYAKLSK